MKSKLTIVLLLLATHAMAWDWWPLPMAEADEGSDSLFYSASVQAVAGYGHTSPFLLQLGRDGDVSASPYSGNLTMGIIKPATRPARWWDYDFGLSLTGRLEHPTDYLHPDARKHGTGYTNLAYAHVRLYIVDITAGVQPEQYGIPDETLTSGGLLFSRNAHPMPGLCIGFDHWTPFPGLFGYVEVLGGMSHQWMTDNVVVSKAKVHHKWAGIRLGGRLPVNISYQFHHVAQWGGYSDAYGDLGNNWRAFLNAVLVRSGGSMYNDRMNAQGNHIGSQILQLDAKGDGWRVSAYWHNLNEDGPLAFIGCGMNAKDGLWGLHAEQSKWPFISGLTYEMVHTTDQSGPFHDRDGMVYGGADNYFRNSVYTNGWNYFYRTLGSPFLTSPVYNSEGETQTRNNRVLAHYIGLRGDIYGYRWRAMVTYAHNYGLYYAPSESTNCGWMLEVTKKVEKAWGLEFSAALAGDAGTQFGNTVGARLSVRKTGLITSWR